MKSYQIILGTCLSALIAFASCQEPVDWQLDGRDTSLLVVDGGITNERTNHLVTLSRTNRDSNAPRVPASGANVIITDGQDVFQLTEFPAGSGLYFTDSVQALAGQTYVLFIQYQGTDYFAADSPVPVEPLDPLTYRPADSGLFTLNFPRGGGPSLTRYFMSWQGSSYCAATSDICFAKILDYNLETIDVNELFKPDKEQVNFPAFTIVVREKHSVSDLYQFYLRSMLSETEWRGGGFDVERGNVTTNLSAGAVGFFHATTIVRDTTIVIPF